MLGQLRGIVSGLSQQRASCKERACKMPYKNYIYEYYAKISSGEIIVGKWIKKIFEIIINGLQTQEYFFNAKAANKAIKFIETFCHHSKGRNDLITWLMQQTIQQKK